MGTYAARSMNGHLGVFIVLTAAAILTMAGSRCANAMSPDLDPRIVAPADVSAMIRLNVPFGGNASARPQPTLTLQTRLLWQPSPAPYGSLYNPSLVEIGVTLSGEPVRRIAGVDLVDTGPQRLNAESGSNNKALWLVLGGVVILGTALGIYSALQDECGNKEYC